MQDYVGVTEPREVTSVTQVVNVKSAFLNHAEIEADQRICYLLAGKYVDNDRDIMRGRLLMAI